MTREIRKETAGTPLWVEELDLELKKMAEKLTSKLLGWQGSAFTVTPEEKSFSGEGKATRAIQAAIDAAAEAGGGTVLLKNGDYVSGTLDFRSGVRLEIGRDARLLASPDLADYPDRVARRRTVMDTNMAMNQSLLFAEGCSNICLCGEGVIDGQGGLFKGDETTGSTPGRPFLIRVIDCADVTMTGITLKDSACWMENYLNCDRVLIDGIHVENQANYNNDGIDIDGCRDVIVRNCVVHSGDDGLCFKGCAQTECTRVLVENCELLSSCNALKIGTDTQGSFTKFLVRNCRLGGIREGMCHIKPLGADSGISWEMVDGGCVDGILVTDCTIDHARSPFFMRMDKRGRVMPGQEKPGIGDLKQLVFEHIRGSENGPRGSYFLGIPEKSIEQVYLHDIRLSQLGTAQLPPTEEAYGELYGVYPDAHMLQDVGTGDAPAYGLWAKYVNGLVLSDYRVEPQGDECRPEFVLQTGVEGRILL